MGVPAQTLTLGSLPEGGPDMKKVAAMLAKYN
jgi:hypothetical protein